MSEQTYRVIRGSIRLPRGVTTGYIMTRKCMVMQGELLPPEIFSDRDIQSWLNEGRIEAAGVSMEQAHEQVAIRASNPFQVDPSTLAGKTMEDLTIMVLEIDPEYDTDALVDVKSAMQLLTSGWQPNMRQTVAPVNDRSRPEALAMHAMEHETDSSGSITHTSQSEMSAKAKEGLAAAKARANAPDPKE